MKQKIGMIKNSKVKNSRYIILETRLSTRVSPLNKASSGRDVLSLQVVGRE